MDWNNQEKAIEALKKEYPHINEYFLIVAYNNWKKYKKLPNNKRRKIEELVKKEKEFPEVEKEIKCIDII